MTPTLTTIIDRHPTSPTYRATSLTTSVIRLYALLVFFFIFVFNSSLLLNNIQRLCMGSVERLCIQRMARTLLRRNQSL
jgi:hypothetical protein